MIYMYNSAAAVEIAQTQRCMKGLLAHGLLVTFLRGIGNTSFESDCPLLNTGRS